MKKCNLALMLIGALSLSACTSALPSCGSTEAENLIQKIINQRSYLVGSFVELKDVEETAFNQDAEIRVCSANLITSKVDEQINYSIKWQNKEKNMFYLEINE